MSRKRVWSCTQIYQGPKGFFLLEPQLLKKIDLFQVCIKLFCLLHMTDWMSSAEVCCQNCLFMATFIPSSTLLSKGKYCIPVTFSILSRAACSLVSIPGLTSLYMVHLCSGGVEPAILSPFFRFHCVRTLCIFWSCQSGWESEEDMCFKGLSYPSWMGLRLKLNLRLNNKFVPNQRLSTWRAHILPSVVSVSESFR